MTCSNKTLKLPVIVIGSWIEQNRLAVPAALAAVVLAL